MACKNYKNISESLIRDLEMSIPKFWTSHAAKCNKCHKDLLEIQMLRAVDKDLTVRFNNMKLDLKKQDIPKMDLTFIQNKLSYKKKNFLETFFRNLLETPYFKFAFYPLSIIFIFGFGWILLQKTFLPKKDREPGETSKTVASLDTNKEFKDLSFRRKAPKIPAPGRAFNLKKSKLINDQFKKSSSGERGFIEKPEDKKKTILADDEKDAGVLKPTSRLNVKGKITSFPQKKSKARKKTGKILTGEKLKEQESRSPAKTEESKRDISIDSQPGIKLEKKISQEDLKKKARELWKKLQKDPQNKDIQKKLKIVLEKLNDKIELKKFSAFIKKAALEE